MNDLGTIARQSALHCEAKNRIVLAGNGVAIVYMGAGQAFIDEADVALVAPFRWSVSFNTKSKVKYARAYAGGGRKKGRYVKMHRLIIGAEPGQRIDHENGNGLDNRRQNIRPITHAANIINSGGAFRSSTSGVRGVCWYPNYDKWRAYIQVNRKTITLGYFSSLDQAAAARAAAEEKYFPGANKRRA